MRYGWAEALSRTGQFYSAIIGQFYPGVDKALGYYTDTFDTYNSKMEIGTYDEHLMMQNSLKNLMEGILSNHWLKIIPSEPSIIGFIKYLLKRDAESTLIPTHERNQR